MSRARVEYTCPLGGERIEGTRFMARHRIPCLEHFEQDNGSNENWFACEVDGCRIAYNSEGALENHRRLDHGEASQ